MKSKRTIYLAALCLALIGVGVSLKIQRDQPNTPKTLFAKIDIRDGQISLVDPALLALAALGTNAVPFLLEKLATPNESEQFRASSVIGVLPVEAKRAAVPGLLRIAQDDARKARDRDLQLLGEIHQEPRLIVPFMISVVADKSENDGSRWFAAIALREYGPDAKEAVPILTTLFGETNFLSRAHAATALLRIDGSQKAAFDFLTASLASKTAKERSAAAYFLSKCGDAARPALPQLKLACKDTDSNVRFNASETVKTLDPAP